MSELVSSKSDSRVYSKVLIVVFFCLAMYTSLYGQNYGMRFSSYEVSLDQRSGLDLTPGDPLSIGDDLDFTFYLKFQPNQTSYFGYIFRLILGDNNLDLIHGIIPENPNNFELIFGEKNTKISFSIPLERLTSEWTKFRFRLDFDDKKISCFINDTVFTDVMSKCTAEDGFRLMFGAHTCMHFSSTDVPRMIIRDVEIRDNKKLLYSWPLNQSKGNDALSFPKGNNGVAKNPDWILHRHNNWESSLKINTGGLVKSTFNPIKNEIYIVSDDSLLIYNLTSNTIQKHRYNVTYKILSITDIIYDTVSQRLVSYSLDNNFVSTYNFKNNTWAPSPIDTILTLYWHHNRQIAPDGSLFAFGGYGEFTYKNLVLACKPGRETFDTIKYSGNFYPRYLAGSGYNANDSLLYFIGGYGSKNGKQSINPGYYYEILSFSFKDNRFKKIVEFHDINTGFCFGNQVVIDKSNNLYALQFAKNMFTNKLQLVKIPLNEPSIYNLATLIDFSFNDVQSNADLFYSPASQQLIAVTSFFNNGRTNFEIYTIDFPPEALQIVKETDSIKWYYTKFLLVAVSLALIIIMFFIFHRRFIFRKKVLLKDPPEITEIRNNRTIGDRSTNHNKLKPNSIILFGGFQVIDKDGTDITGSFSPLLKKLFLFILLNSLRYNKGVSSTILSETFWFDKTIESARNNRAVNVIKLRTFLENVGTSSISKDTGNWKFEFDPDTIYIDYYEYLRITSKKTELGKDKIIELLAIIDSGPFLQNMNDDWLDNYKSELSNDIIDTLISYINRSEDDPEFILHLTNCIFLFDFANEEAMSIQCKLLVKLGKHSLAKQTYAKFLKEYKQLYDEDYSKSFNQIIEEK